MNIHLTRTGGKDFKNQCPSFRSWEPVSANALVLPILQFYLGVLILLILTSQYDWEGHSKYVFTAAKLKNYQTQSQQNPQTSA